ncbi:uncharacterized protein LOC134546220 [Bacillus rossius redtenbacheri]|uniref:uncharacterized protein LOC134546220 n=1 Tax=Bacillus rossius redtenbacheri TaxID=93214 RepID=UPI002FDE4046
MIRDSYLITELRELDMMFHRAVWRRRVKQLVMIFKALKGDRWNLGCNRGQTYHGGKLQRECRRMDRRKPACLLTGREWNGLEEGMLGVRSARKVRRRLKAVGRVRKCEDSMPVGESPFIPDSDFLTFAEYMGAASGSARASLERRAAGIVAAVEKRQELLAGGAEAVQVERDHPELKVDTTSYERARTLLQCFQEV